MSGSGHTQPFSDTEAERRRALRRYRVCEALAQPGFDRLARLALRVFDASIVHVAFWDAARRWVKTGDGVEGRAVPCPGEAALPGTVTVTADARLAGSPEVGGDAGFYASAPFHTPDGLHLGTLHVMCPKRRRLDGGEQEVMADLAAQMMSELERHAEAPNPAQDARDAQALRHEQEMQAAREALERANERTEAEMRRREQAETSLRQLARQMALLLEGVQDAVWLLDADGRLCYWNRSAERLLGWRLDEVKDARVLYNDAPGAYEEARRQVRADGAYRAETALRTRSGDPVVVESRWTSVRAAPDGAAHVLVVNTDVTGRKRLEEQFLRAQRLESLGTLAGGIAHDLNNILGPILMSVELLGMEITGEPGLTILDRLDTGARRAADLVQQVLRFARGAEGERQALHLDELAGEVVKILQETLPPSVEVQTAMQDDLPVVEGDVTQIHQVLLNLCVNARDAMADGGVLRIDVCAQEVGAERAGLHKEARPGAYVLITVTDTGAGMPPEVLDKIFEPFFTTKQKGTGLGLSTSIGIVRGHGGFLDVHSEPGRGTRFQVYLPVSEPIKETATPVAPVHSPPSEGGLILVVDDEMTFRNVVQTVLTGSGYRTLGAAHGAEALALFEAHQHTIGAVVTDIMMSEMDGYAFVAALRERSPDVKVIVVSGLTSSEEVAKVDRTGADVVLAKPCSTEQLMTALDQVLRVKE